MNQDTEQTVFDVVSEITGKPRGTLTRETRFSELELEDDDNQEIYEECCRRTGASLNDIIASMPIYRLRTGETTFASLRNIAAFSARARRLLALYDVRVEDETLASVAESLQQGRYVSSGNYLPSFFEPRSKLYVICWSLGLIAIALAVPIFFNVLNPKPLCLFPCLVPPLGDARFLYICLAIALGLIVVGIVPGLIELRSKRARRLLKDSE